jgi:hypothetical protein
MLCHEKPSDFSQPPPGLEDSQIGWFVSENRQAVENKKVPYLQPIFQSLGKIVVSPGLDGNPPIFGPTKGLEMATRPLLQLASRPLHRDLP